MGLLGLFAFGWTLVRTRMSDRAGIFDRAALAVLAVVLVIGSHFEFIEVTLIAGLILAKNLEFDDRPIGFGANAVLCLVILVVGIRGALGEFGTYDFESDGRRVFRWTSRHAAFLLPCSDDGSARLRLRAFEHNSPLTVLVESPEEKLSVELPPNEIIERELSCPRLLPPAGSNFPGAIMVRATASRIWAPRKFGYGNDSRPLGFQLILGLGKDFQ